MRLNHSSRFSAGDMATRRTRNGGEQMIGLYCVFYKETKKSQWTIYRILMSRYDALETRKYGGWYKSKMMLITAPLELSK